MEVAYANRNRILSISSGYPKDIRCALRLGPGQKMTVIELDGRIELIPDQDIADLEDF